MSAIMAPVRPTRVSTASEPPSEADLDYFSKPENYTGSNMLNMRRAVIFGKNNGSNLKTSQDLTSKQSAEQKLYERYRDYAFDDGLDNDIITYKKSVTVLENRPSSRRGKERRKSLVKSCPNTESMIPDTIDLTLPRPLTTSGMPRDASCSPSSDDSRETWRLSARAKTSMPGYHHHSRYSSINSLLNMRDAKMARDRFRHATRIILILLKWISSLSEAGDGLDGGDGGGRTFTDIANEAFTSEELRNSGLSFDLSKFKAKREMNVSSEVKTILSIPSHVRGNDQIQTALIGLQHMKSFAEYPLHMQEKLCKVAWFQQVPPKRVIIRQGHFAENFYFILSGQAVVRILDKNPKGEVQLRTAAVMNKGTSFGELALLHHSMRTATVVSQDTVQLLAIGRDDFFDIFMAGSGPDGMPEHIRFVSQLDFMRDWPIHNLLEHPECCLFHFFKRGVVIVKDSDYSDWLYIIKSGSCQVMKELKGVKANITKPQKSLKSSQSFCLPKLGTGEVTSKIDTGRRRMRHCATPDISWDPYTNDKDDKDRKGAKSPFDNASDGRGSVETIKPVMLTVPPHTDGPGYSKSRFAKFLNSRKSHSNISVPPLRTSPRSSSASPRMHSPRAKTAKKDAELEVPEELRGPVFVQVEVLKPKDTFGLISIQFDDDVEVAQTSVSLVSNGAECIMLSKKFFCMHATEKVKKRIRCHVRPYPTDRALQDNLQTKVDWDIYKKQLIRNMLAEKARAAMLTSSSKT